MITAGVVRTLLIVDMVGMALLALFYLRQRRMTLVSYCGWGLLALLVPVIGPFVLISTRPGEMDPTASVFNDVRRLVLLFWQLLLRLAQLLLRLPIRPLFERLVQIIQNLPIRPLFERLGQFIQRLLPDPPPQSKLTRLEKARMRRNKRKEP